MAEQDKPLQRIPRPEYIKGISDERWNALSAESQLSLVTLAQGALASQAVSTEQVADGKFPMGVTGNTKDGLTQIF